MMFQKEHRSLNDEINSHCKLFTMLSYWSDEVLEVNVSFKLDAYIAFHLNTTSILR